MTPISGAEANNLQLCWRLLADGSDASDFDIEFSRTSLSAFKFSSKVVPVSIEILQDSSVDIVAYVIDLLAKRLGRAENPFFTLGTGTNQPKGAVTGAALGVRLPTGNSTKITYGGIVSLYNSLDPAYRMSPSCAWMMNDSTLLAVRNLVDSAAHPLFLPDLIPGPDGSPRQGTVFNKPVIVNNDMPNIGASAKPILFGDFSQYAIRQVSNVSVMRLDDSNYSKNGQVAFIAFARADGVETSPMGVGIRYLQNSES